MGAYADIINKRKKDWNCATLMDSAHAERSDKLPFSSPLLNYSTYGGIPRRRITEFFGDPGGGKAQPLDAHILTPSGWMMMRDAQVGQTIFDGKGTTCKIDGVYPQGVRDIYRITFDDNTSIRVSDEHLNVCWRDNADSGSREDFCIETLDLIELMDLSDYKKHSKLRVDIPVVDWPEQLVDIDPYLLGVLIGSGDLASGTLDINGEDSPVLDIVRRVLERDWGCTLIPSDSDSTVYHIYNYQESSGRSRLLTALEKYQLICNPFDLHIPKEYLYNTRKVRIQLLQGLYDINGVVSTYDPADDSSSVSYEYSTLSPQFSEDLAFLVRSLGIKDTIVRNKSVYSWDGVKTESYDSYDHYFGPFEHSSDSTLQIDELVAAANLHPVFRSIIDIEYIGSEECQCIHVDSEAHTYITDYFTPTHNTSTAIDICKNAHDIFVQEYENELSALRERANTEKVAAAMLQDLEDRGPKKILYGDLEHSFDAEWARKLGIHADTIDIMQPPDIYAEELLQTVQELIETGELGLVVIDSVPSLITKQELEKKYGERTVASLAGLLTVFCKKIVPILERCDTTLLFINQVRDNMDNPYVLNTPGGRALKFYCSLRIQFKIGSPVDFLGNELPNNAENPSGHIVTAKIIKQKSAPWDRKNASYYLMAQSGIEVEMDFAQLAVKKYGIVKKQGAWYTLTDPYTGEILEDETGKLVKVNGMAKVLDFFRLNPEYFKKIQNYILADIAGEDQIDPENIDTVVDETLAITANNTESIF